MSTAFSSDGVRLAGGTNRGKALVWEAETGSVVREVDGQGVMRVALTSDGARLAVADDSRTVKVWDVASGSEVHSWGGLQHKPTRVRFSPDGSLVAVTDFRGSVLVWDAESGTPKYALSTNRGAAYDLAFHPSGEELIAVGLEAIRWNMTSGAPISSWDKQGQRMESVAWSTDGAHIVTGKQKLYTFFWDKETGDLKHKVRGHNSAVRHAAFSEDDEVLLTADKSSLWNAEDGRHLITVPNPGGVSGLSMSPDGTTLALSSSSLTVLWRLGEEKPVAALDALVGAPHAQFATDGQHLVTWGRNGVFGWNAASGAKRFAITPGDSKKFDAVAVTPDGQKVVTAVEERSSSGSKQLTVVEWDGATGEPQRTLTPSVSGITWAHQMSYRPEGGVLAVRSTHRVQVWDADFHLVTLRDQVANADVGLLWAPVGGTIASASKQGPVVLWDPTHGGTLHELDVTASDGKVTALEFSKDATRLAAVLKRSDGNSVRVWDVASGSVLHNALPDVASKAHDLAFSPDGRLLAGAFAVGMTGGRLVVWNLGNGTTLLNHEVTGDPLLSVAFTPDGTTLLSGSGNGVTTVWSVTQAP